MARRESLLAWFILAVSTFLSGCSTSPAGSSGGVPAPSCDPAATWTEGSGTVGETAVPVLLTCDAAVEAALAAAGWPSGIEGIEFHYYRYCRQADRCGPPEPNIGHVIIRFGWPKQALLVPVSVDGSTILADAPRPLP